MQRLAANQRENARMKNLPRMNLGESASQPYFQCKDLPRIDAETRIPEKSNHKGHEETQRKKSGEENKPGGANWCAQFVRVKLSWKYRGTYGVSE
jgi:hypothetical protein